MRKILLGALALIAGATAVAQSNDNFANRIALSGTNVMTELVPIGAATNEPDEPSNHYWKDVWYSWTAPDNLTVTFSVGNSQGNFTPTLNVYIGDSLQTLQAVKAAVNSDVTFSAVKGLTYQIAVGSYYSNDSGSTRLRLWSTRYSSCTRVIGPDPSASAAPANDRFADSKTLPDLPLTVVTYHNNATRETGERHPWYRSLWYSYTAPSSQVVHFHVEAASAGTGIAVFQGDSSDKLVWVSSSSSDTSSFTAVQGITYRIAIADYYSGDSYSVKRIHLWATPLDTSAAVVGPETPLNQTPHNDSFQFPQSLAGPRLTVVAYNRDATRETFEPSDGNNTLWYTWQASVTGTLTLAVQSPVASKVAVWTGSDLYALTALGSSTNGSLSVEVTAGSLYRISLGSYYSGDPGEFYLSLVAGGSIAAPQIVTHPLSQTVETGARATLTVSATGLALHFQWYKDGKAIPGAIAPLLTIAQAAEADEGVYTVVVSNGGGTATSNLAALTVLPAPPVPTITAQPQSQTVAAGTAVTLSVAAASDSPLSYRWFKNGEQIAGAETSALVLSAVAVGASGDYAVEVTNAAGSVPSSPAHLEVNPTSTTAPANDNFANRMIMTGTSFTTDPVLITNATREVVEPYSASKDVWYSWTAPDNLEVTLSTSESDSGFVQGIFVFTGGSLPELNTVMANYGSTVKFLAVKGITYQIAVVSRYSDGTGYARLGMASSSYSSGVTILGPDPLIGGSPANDHLANARDLGQLPLAVVSYHASASLDTAERGVGYRTLWYRYTAPANQVVNMLVEWSNAATGLSVLQGDDYDRMTWVRYSSDNSLTFIAAKGATYFIAVADYYSGDSNSVKRIAISAAPITGSGALVISPAPRDQTVANDQFLTPQIVSGDAFTTIAYTNDADREIFEPADGNQTVWYQWSPARDGVLSLTAGGDDTAVVTAYTGDDLATLTSLGQAIAGKVLNVPVEAGKIYRIALGRTNYSSGDTFLLSFLFHSLTIGTIANQTINEDTTTPAIPVSLGGTDLASGTLSIAATTSNPSLLPISGITWGGSGANRTIALKPAANQFGTVTITVTVSNGTVSTNRSFVLTVKPVNDAPTFGPTANFSLYEDTPGTLGFTVSDIETAASQLAVSVAGSNSTLFPSGALVLGGSGANRTLTLKPAANLSGSANITLTVSDGAAKTSRSFTVTVLPVDDAPTLSSIAARTINEDTSSTATFTIADIDTPISGLVVTASSSNTLLLPAGSLALTGSGANRTLTIKPAKDQNGTATVSVAVTDGTWKTTRSFILTVKPVNDAPTISAIASRTLALNSNTGALRFTVADPDTALSALKLTATSSNTSLVPVKSIVFAGSSANRTVKVTPATGKTGTAVVTIQVSDGKLSAKSSFFVTVTATNHAPTISAIASRTINEDTSTPAIAFTIADADTAPELLLLTGSSSNTKVLPNAGIVFGGSKGNRTVTLKPAANQSGTAVVSIKVSDGTLTTTRTFTVTVKAVNDAPTISAIAGKTITSGGNTGALAFKVADVDTAVTTLKVTGTSSNPALVPASGLVFGGSGANRTIKVTAAKGKTGQATITVTVSDGGLKASTSFKVTVVAAIKATSTAGGAAGLPVLTTDLVDQTVLAGGTATFAVVASDPDSTYRWYKNDTPIPAATQPTLTIERVQPTDAADYTVAVTNSAGVVVSSPAALTVVSAQLQATVTGPQSIALSGAFAVTGEADGSSLDLVLPAGWSCQSAESTGSSAQPHAGDTQLLSWTAASPAAQPVVFTCVLRRSSGAPLPAKLETLVEISQAGRTTRLLPVATPVQ